MNPYKNISVLRSEYEKNSQMDDESPKESQLRTRCTILESQVEVLKRQIEVLEEQNKELKMKITRLYPAVTSSQDENMKSSWKKVEGMGDWPKEAFKKYDSHGLQRETIKKDDGSFKI